MEESWKIRKVRNFSYGTRLFLISVQFLANYLIPDHNSGTFVYPKESTLNSYWDNVVWTLFGGFLRWDSQYFMHIARYGYTYENTLAFFPLYPVTASCICMLLKNVIYFITEDTLLLIILLLINLILFSKASEALYNLTLELTHDENLAYKAAILFCINPASIFFSAPYTECIFAYLTFKSMLNCIKVYRNGPKSNIIDAIIPVTLSTCTRSNGLLNVGFLVYFLIKSIYDKSTKFNLKNFVTDSFYVIFCVIICLVPFGAVQMYFYFLYCKDFANNLPDFLVNYGEIHGFVMPGLNSKYNQSWCQKMIPISYSYVQEHYWNVGFLRYYELKQVPNFLLALPIVVIILRTFYKFAREHREHCINLGIFNFVKLGKSYAKVLYHRDMFVFVSHALFLTIFCLFCVHVQVTTRMLCSGSPVVYWFAAYSFRNVKLKEIDSPFKLLTKNSLNLEQKCIKCYFLSYLVIGTILCCNFLPWT